MSSPQRTENSPWAIQVVRLFGIPIRLHVTFLLFLAWVAYVSRPNAAFAVSFVGILFFCVVLHELGHALVARHFGIETSAITLYFVGGLALIQGHPKPRAEFWIAIAGPLVNVVIAGFLAPIVFLREGHLPSLSFVLSQETMLDAIFSANVALALFNLIPAFPMDGGRILRALLAMRGSETKATIAAGAIAQILALFFFFGGLFVGSVLLMAIGAWVFLGADLEVGESMRRSLLAGHTVRQAMQTRFETVISGAPLEDASRVMLESGQEELPVVAGDETVGLLSRQELLAGMSADGPTGYVAGYMTRDFASVTPDMKLVEALDRFQGQRRSLLVLDGNAVVGMLTLESLNKFLSVENAKARRRGFMLRP